MPEGVFEVRVPAADAARAEEMIAENPLPDEVEEVDRLAGTRPGDHSQRRQ